MARKPTETMGATDSVDGEVIKGTMVASSASSQEANGSASGLGQNGSSQDPTSGSDGFSGAAPQETGSAAGDAPSHGLRSELTSLEQSASSAMSSLASDAAEVEQFGATVIHTTVASMQALTQDVEVAMQRVRSDVSRLHTLVSNTGHYASLPIIEAEKLIASLASHLGVIRGG